MLAWPDIFMGFYTQQKMASNVFENIESIYENITLLLKYTVSLVE